MFVGERAEAVGDPGREDQAAHDEADEHERAAEQQAVLEAEARAHAVEPGVLLAHEVGAVGVRAQPQREHLGADDHQQRAADQRVHAPGAPEEVEARADERRRSACRGRRAARRAR